MKKLIYPLVALCALSVSCDENRRDPTLIEYDDRQKEIIRSFIEKEHIEVLNIPRMEFFRKSNLFF
jgi:hypothetical protein